MTLAPWTPTTGSSTRWRRTTCCRSSPCSRRASGASCGPVTASTARSRASGRSPSASASARAGYGRSNDARCASSGARRSLRARRAEAALRRLERLLGDPLGCPPDLLEHVLLLLDVVPQEGGDVLPAHRVGER